MPVCVSPPTSTFSNIIKQPLNDIQEVDKKETSHDSEPRHYVKSPISARSRTQSIHSDSGFETPPDDTSKIIDEFLHAIETSDPALFHSVCTKTDSATLLHIALTHIYGQGLKSTFQFDQDAEQEGRHFFGSNIGPLSLLQVAVFFGEEEMALDLIDQIQSYLKDTEGIENQDAPPSRIVWHDLLNKLWGDGNTILHLASFWGMGDLVKRLLILGASPNKLNGVVSGRRYKPVDCAGMRSFSVLLDVHFVKSQTLKSNFY